MKIHRNNYNTNKNQDRNNIISLKKKNISNKDRKKKEREKEDWKNKKINLNFFENKNLIKELRAKYLPNSQIHNNSEALLNLNDINNKNELNDSSREKNELFLNTSKQSLSSILNDENINEKIDSKNDKSEESEKQLINNINKKSKENNYMKKNKVKTTKIKKNKNIVIENRFYTEIINSNILLDKNLILNSLYHESNSLKNKNKENEKDKFNNNINYRNNMNLNLIKNESDALTKNGNNQYVSLSLKNIKFDSVNQNLGESSTNKEINYIKNKEILESIFNATKSKGRSNSAENNKEKKDILKLENKKMKKELKNYEQLITPLINYINDINRILDQKEINPNDIEKIIKNDNTSQSSLYIKNLISNLNNSKDDIAFKLDKFKNSKKLMKYKKRNSQKIINLKEYNLKGRRINRSAEDIKNVRFINNRISFEKKEKGNYFYDDISDKYIFDYYKDRNINCSACLIGNNISQRGYSPNICCHLEDDKEENDESDNNNLEEN